MRNNQKITLKKLSQDNHTAKKKNCYNNEITEKIVI